MEVERASGNSRLSNGLSQSKYDMQHVFKLRDAMLSSTHGGVDALRECLPTKEICELLESAHKLLKAEPTVLEVMLFRIFSAICEKQLA